MQLTINDIEEFRAMLMGRARYVHYLFREEWPNELGEEDVVSDTITKAWVRREQFYGDRSRKGQVAAWLLSTLNRTISDALKRARTQKRGGGRTMTFEDFVSQSESRFEQFLVADVSTASTKLQRGEMIAAAYSAIELLPVRQRTCLLARFIGEYSIEAIVEQLNETRPVRSEPVTTKAVTSLIERALRKLRDLLQHLG